MIARAGQRGLRSMLPCSSVGGSQLVNILSYVIVDTHTHTYTHISLSLYIYIYIYVIIINHTIDDTYIIVCCILLYYMVHILLYYTVVFYNVPPQHAFVLKWGLTLSPPSSRRRHCGWPSCCIMIASNS